MEKCSQHSMWHSAVTFTIAARHLGSLAFKSSVAANFMLPLCAFWSSSLCDAFEQMTHPRKYRIKATAQPLHRMLPLATVPLQGPNHYTPESARTLHKSTNAWAKFAKWHKVLGTAATRHILSMDGTHQTIGCHSLQNILYLTVSILSYNK